MVGFVEALKRQSGAKNIVIHFKQGTAEAAWKQGARFDYAAVKKAVSKSADLTFRAVSITVRGEVMEQAGKPALKVPETGQLFLLAEASTASPARDSPLSKLMAAARPGVKQGVTVTGQVQEPRKSTAGQPSSQPLTLMVERAAPVQSVREP